MRSALLHGTTLGASLAHLAEVAPGAVATFPGSGDRITARELDVSADAAARAFRVAGIAPGEVVGVLVGTTTRFFTTIFGLWRAGAAISVLPVQAGFGDDTQSARRLARIVTAAGMRHLVLDAAHTVIGDLLRADLPELTVLDPAAVIPDAVVPAGTAGTAGPPRPLPEVDPESLAVVQFTSGSTSAPKGVMLPHRTLIAGLRACVVSGAFSPDDVFVQWVPTFHDMGLVGLLSHWLNGADVHVFTPTAFLRKPERVLEYFAEHRGTVITGPNFSYDYLLDAVPPERLARLDLSAWRLAFNGAEPVSAATVRRFTEEFAVAGVAASVMYPVYGMAEATLSISYPHPGETARRLSVDRAALAAHGIARPVPDDAAAAKPVVSVGHAVHGVRIRIAGDQGQAHPDGRLGEIQIAGEPITTGYFRDPAATGELFDGEWLRTGDLGFRLDGELYVTGRAREMVVVRGQNFFPDDVEDIAREVPGVYRRRCVAFPDIAEDGTERIGVIVETNEPEQQVRAEVARRVAAELDFAQVRVHTVKPRWLTRTTSGKWQRVLASQRIADGAGEQ